MNSKIKTSIISAEPIIICRKCGRSIGEKYFKFHQMKEKNDKKTFHGLEDNREIIKKLNLDKCPSCVITVLTSNVPRYPKFL